MPKISVIMPAYNAEKYIGEAIESILNQTYTDFEFIIIDDGSSDGTVLVVKSYDDKRIRFYQNEQNMGVAATLNRGLDLATGEYIARMDSDDISLPERFEKQIAFMDSHSEVAVIGTGVELFSAQIGTRVFSSSYEALKVDLLFGNCLAHPTVMMRKCYFGKEKLHYDPSFGKMEDFDLWERTAQFYPIMSLTEILLKYRIHPNQVTQKPTEENRVQLKRLKERQLRRLGVQTEGNGFETYMSYCLGELNISDTSVRDLVDFLNCIQEKNDLVAVYDKSVLTSYFLSVKKGVLAKLPGRIAISIAGDCRFNPISYGIERIARMGMAKLWEKIQKKRMQSKLKSKEFSIISNNCWGSFIYQRYGLEYKSPTVGLYFLGSDFVKLASNWEHYFSCKLEFIPWSESSYYYALKDEVPYPVARLDDIEVYFMHYKSEGEAAEKWYRRVKRIKPDHILFKLSQREECSKKDVEDFMKLPLEHRVCFAYDDVPGTINIPELEWLRGDEMPIVDRYYNELPLLNAL